MKKRLALIVHELLCGNCSYFEPVLGAGPIMGLCPPRGTRRGLEAACDMFVDFRTPQGTRIRVLSDSRRIAKRFGVGAEEIDRRAAKMNKP